MSRERNVRPPNTHPAVKSATVLTAAHEVNDLERVTSGEPGRAKPIPRQYYPVSFNHHDVGIDLMSGKKHLDGRPFGDEPRLTVDDDLERFVGDSRV